MNNRQQSLFLTHLSLSKLLTYLMKEGYLLGNDYEKLKEKSSNDYIKQQINQMFRRIKAKKKEVDKIRKFFNISNKYLYLSHKGFRLTSPLLIAENGELLEQFCWSGHNVYPFPKVIDELMTDEKNIYITREAANLPVVIIKKDAINFSSLRYKSYDSLLNKRLPYLLKQVKERTLVKDNETVIPIHVFQLNRDPLLKRLKNKGKIQIISVPYKHFLLTSTRTIYVSSDNMCIKLPINIKITSEKRLIFQSFSHNAPIFGRIIKEIIAKEKSIQSSFLIAEDIASVRVKDYSVARHLCAIFREPVLINKNIYPANYLFEIFDIKTNKRVIQELFSYKFGNKRKLISTFFEKYMNVIIQAPLILYIKYGIGTEPHLQNSFIMLNDRFMPVKIVLRDIDGININMSVLSQKLDTANYNFHSLTRFMFKSDQFSSIRLWDSLIIFHIQELINILSDNYNFSSKQLWHKVIREIKSILKKLSLDPNNKERIKMFNEYFLSEVVPTRAFIEMKISDSETFKTIDMKNFLYIK